MLALYRLAALAILLGLWFLISLIVGPNFVPDPLRTATAAAAMMRDGKIFEAAGQSITIYLGGYFLAIAVAIPVAMIMGGIPNIGRTLDVYVNALMATPRVAFIPLVIVFLGLGAEAKMFIVFLGAVMPILINTYAGILNSDTELIEMARSAGASRFQIYLAHHASRRPALHGGRSEARRDDRADQHSGRGALYCGERIGRTTRLLWKHVPDGSVFRRRPGARLDRHGS